MIVDLPTATDSAGLDSVQAAAIAAELVALTHRLTDLACDLGSDSHTLRTHMHSLQSIDLINQIQLALADVLRSPAPFPARLQAIPVEALAKRLAAYGTASAR